jgi:hypothetical protein
MATVTNVVKGLDGTADPGNYTWTCPEASMHTDPACGSLLIGLFIGRSLFGDIFLSVSTEPTSSSAKET